MVPPHGRAAAKGLYTHGHDQTLGELKFSFFFGFAAAASRLKPTLAKLSQQDSRKSRFGPTCNCRKFEKKPKFETTCGCRKSAKIWKI